MNKYNEEKQDISYKWVNKTYAWLCKRESVFCFAILTVVLCYGFWPILSAPNTNYPMTVDGMGHLTKIQYLADCIKDFNWPSWFPYWYNGSTVMQYYPPLSYLLLSPVQMISDNVMVTFKFFCFFSLLVGGIGIWAICHRFVGPLVGIWAGVLYVLQPYLMKSILLAGLIAQGPIFALSPWLLFFTFLFLENKTSSRWLIICMLIFVMILSHPMHTFMITIAIAPVILILVLLHRISIRDLLLWGLAIAMGGGLAAFWWIVGVTQLETPGIPYLLAEATVVYTANLSWYNPLTRHTGSFYFSLAILICALLSILIVNRTNKTRNKSNFSYNDNALIIATWVALIGTIILSFGYHIPFFEYLPMSKNLVPGRILSFAAVLSSILCGVLLFGVIKKWHNGLWYKMALLALILVGVVVLIDINPSNIRINSSPYKELQSDLDTIPFQKNAFKNGRFNWLLPTASDITYFPMIKGFNMTDGWNIEGTPHNRAIWQHNIAIPVDCSDFVVRNLLFWNTRSVFISNQDDTVINGLIKNKFQTLKKDNEKTILFNPTPSSYFLRQERDALAIGKAALNLEMNFPWMVRGYSTCLEEYPLEYLERFKLIYLIETEVKDFTRFQSIVEQLASAGKVVIVSMGRGETWPLLDIIPYWETIKNDSDLKPIDEGPITGEARLEADPTGQVPALGNVDILWAVMQGEDKEIPAIGYKEVNGNRVYFVGLALGQQLNSAQGEQIRIILEQLMALAHPNKSIVPNPFPVLKEDWRHDGFSFSYDSAQPAPVLVSVTYTPRWKAWLDGKPLHVQNMDNLIYIELPAGKHQVSFHYGMTWVGKLGIALSLLALLLVALIYFYFEYLDMFFCQIKEKICNYIRLIGE